MDKWKFCAKFTWLIPLIIIFIMVLFVWGFLTGRELSIWPPKIGGAAQEYSKAPGVEASPKQKPLDQLASKSQEEGNTPKTSPSPAINGGNKFPQTAEAAQKNSEKLIYEFRDDDWELSGDTGKDSASLTPGVHGPTVTILKPTRIFTHIQLKQILFEKNIALIPDKTYALNIHVTVDKPEILKCGFFEEGTWKVVQVPEHVNFSLSAGENNLRGIFKAKKLIAYLFHYI
jgi:hypothetical protein